MNNNKPLLEVKGLKTYFYTEDGIVRAVDGVSFEVYPGEVLGLVGESGCGKSVTSLSIMRLISKPGNIDEGEILLDGENLLELPEHEMIKVRGNRISMIFQQPQTALNPVFKVGDQLAEVLDVLPTFQDVICVLKTAILALVESVLLLVNPFKEEGPHLSSALRAIWGIF